MDILINKYFFIVYIPNLTKSIKANKYTPFSRIDALLNDILFCNRRNRF